MARGTGNRGSSGRQNSFSSSAPGPRVDVRSQPTAARRFTPKASGDNVDQLAGSQGFETSKQGGWQSSRGFNPISGCDKYDNHDRERTEVLLMLEGLVNGQQRSELPGEGFIEQDAHRRSIGLGRFR